MHIYWAFRAWKAELVLVHPLLPCPATELQPHFWLGQLAAALMPPSHGYKFQHVAYRQQQQ